MIELAATGLATTVALMTGLWLASLAKRDASIIDIFWGPGFALLAWLYFLMSDQTAARQLVVPSLVTVWGLRLGLHILWRSRGRGEDYRYAEMRGKWGSRFPAVSLVTVFWLQAALLWLIAMPFLQLQQSPQSGRLTWLDVAGFVLFAIGLLFEVVGDHQLARFKADPANRGEVLDTGLWRYTRHPNYFGDATLWWGLWLMTAAADGGLWTVASPLVMTVLLLKVSGVALLEKGLEKTKPGYRDYVRRTSAFLPWPPKSP